MFRRKWLETKEERWRDFETEAMPFAPDLYRVAMWLTRNQTEAEDLVQETFFQAMRSFHHYEMGTNCRAWLTTIMYNLNSKRLQKLGRMKIVDDPEEKLAATIPFEPQLPQKLTDEEVIKALKNVPEIFRQAVVLSDVEGFSYKEIAEIMDIPMGTVMSRLSRGRKVLRQELAEYARNYGFGDTERKIAAC
jgi:RNA polymerase sigma-70 factor (ECF subfamily)